MVELSIDKRTYAIEVHRRVNQPRNAPRLVIVAYQPNELAKQVLHVCIQAIQHYTPEPHELWVVDNNSPIKDRHWLLQWPSINVVFNQTDPLPPEGRDFLTLLVARMKGRPKQRSWASYANAIGVEIAVRLIDPDSRYLMPLHMDTMPCRIGWLSFLESKLNAKVRAAGVRMDKKQHRTPKGVLHVLGYLVDFQLFKELDLDFFPKLPRYDVGDRVTVALRDAGYGVFACRNTLWLPELIEEIPASSPLRNFSVDRSLDDDGNVIFLHLGRGVGKALGKQTRRTSSAEWVEFADEYLLVDSVGRCL
jgi:hypothetical protein